MYVFNRMTPTPVTVAPDTTARKALDIMQTKKFSNLPVIDDGKLVGIIAKEDIVNQYFCGEQGCSFLEDTPVSELMTTRFVTVKKLDYIEKAAFLLKEKDISALPVIDVDDKMIGIITRTDIFGAFTDTMGVDIEGARLYLVLPDFVGQIARIATIIKHHGVSISAMSVFDSGIVNTKQMVIKVNSRDIEKLVEDLKHGGIEIRDIGYF